MNDLNRCEFIGRLGSDPESRFLPSGDEVVNIRIAVGKSWKDKQGQKQEKTEWVPIVFFGGLAGVCSRFLKKGSRIYIAGEFRTRKWQSQDGQDRYATEVVATEMQMLDGRQGGEAREASPPPAHGAAQDGAGGQNSASGFDDFDGDGYPF